MQKNMFSFPCCNDEGTVNVTAGLSDNSEIINSDEM